MFTSAEEAMFTPLFTSAEEANVYAPVCAFVCWSYLSVSTISKKYISFWTQRKVAIVILQLTEFV